VVEFLLGNEELGRCDYEGPKAGNKPVYEILARFKR